MTGFCPTCHARVPEHCDSISCDNCRKWYHLKCTELTKTQFEIFTKDKSFEWVCDKCDSKTCNKCNILTNPGNKIQCERCLHHFHLRCAGLSKAAYIPTVAWYCFQCHEDIFPFSNISIKQISNLTFNSLYPERHPNQLCST